MNIAQWVTQFITQKKERFLREESENISTGEQGAEHTYRHSDPAKRNLNQSFIITEHCRKPLHQAISDRISEGYSAKNKAGELKQIRKDAVKYSTHILTGSHEDMKRIEANPEELKNGFKPI